MKVVDSFLMRAVIGMIFLLVNIMSVYLLLRGHNLPGGGFIGGLITGLSFILLGLVRGWEELQRELPLPPLRLATLGLVLAIGIGSLPMLINEPFMTQYSIHLPEIPLLGTLHIGTALFFDVCVFLLVSCITVKLVIVLARTTSGLTAFTASEALYYASVLEEAIEQDIKEKKTGEDEYAD